MNPRLKFHAIAIAAIVVIVTALYSVMGPQKSSVAAANTSGKAIEIHSATWGEQCNQAITEALAARALAPVALNATGKALPQESLALVAPNNVLVALGAACNGKSSCELRANMDALGTDPMASCFKRLVVSYRCFRFDRLTTLDIGQGERLSIDCLNQKSADDAAPNAR